MSIAIEHLLQLNLLIWMSLPAAPAPVRRVFWETGYSIWAISPEVAAPPAKLRHLRALGSSEGGRAEIALRRSNPSHLVLIECKADSFTLASSNAAQLLLFMGVTDRDLRDALGINPRESIQSDLVYFLPAGRSAAMLDTLTEAAAKFAAKSLRCHPGTVLELQEQADGLYARLIGPELSDGLLDSVLRPGPRVVEYSDEHVDWRPLYLMPIDPSVAGLATDAVGKAIVEERIRAPLLALVGRQLGTSFVIDVDAVLRSAIPVWDLWVAPDGKKSLVRFATNLVSTLTKELVAAGVTVSTMGNRRYQVQPIDSELAARLRRGIARSVARNVPLDLTPGQPELFEDA